MKLRSHLDFGKVRIVELREAVPAREAEGHLQCRPGSGVAAADADDALAVVRIRLTAVVMHGRQILAGHTRQDRMVEVADSLDAFSRGLLRTTSPSC